MPGPLERIRNKKASSLSISKNNPEILTSTISNMKSEIIKSMEIKTESFSLWLDKLRRAQRTGDGMDVECGTCRACCTSSYFIHIKAEEKTTISNIPKKLMFPAPGHPKGSKLLGFDEKGMCPMLKKNKCSIYDFRPLTCRSYDCRIFSATGIMPGKERKLISRQVERWRFDFSGASDLRKYNAVRMAAHFVREHAACFPAGFIPDNAPRQAMLAVKVYEVFLDLPASPEDYRNEEMNKKIAARIVDVYEKFECGENNEQ